MKPLLLIAVVLISMGLKPINSTQIIVKNIVTENVISGVNIQLWKADKIIWTGVTNENGIVITDKIGSDNYHFEFQREGFLTPDKWIIKNQGKAETFFRIEVSMTPLNMTPEQQKIVDERKKEFEEKLNKIKN